MVAICCCDGGYPRDPGANRKCAEVREQRGKPRFFSLRLPRFWIKAKYPVSRHKFQEVDTWKGCTVVVHSSSPKYQKSCGYSQLFFEGIPEHGASVACSFWNPCTWPDIWPNTGISLLACPYWYRNWFEQKTCLKQSFERPGTSTKNLVRFSDTTSTQAPTVGAQTLARKNPRNELPTRMGQCCKYFTRMQFRIGFHRLL